MGSTSKVLPIRQKIVIHVREYKQGELLFSFLIIFSKPFRARLKFSETLASSVSLILKNIFKYLKHFIIVALKPIIRLQDLRLFE